MTAATAASRPSSARGRFVPWLVMAAGLVLVALLAGAPGGNDGERFDPSSTDPNGTRALVELLESFGAVTDVDTAAPTAESDVVVLFADALDDSAASLLESWVRNGGTLVVADPFSVFTPPLESQTGAFGVAPALERGSCDIEALADLARIDPGRAVTYEVESGRRSCFGGDTDAYAVESVLGDGTVVALGGAELFTNAHLDEADNAALAGRLLVPRSGTRVTILLPGEGEGATDRSLSEVMSTGVRLAIVQLVVAFVVYAWFRARRLGRPVTEAQPVEVAGSELVLAVGQLLQQSDDPNRAARLLRSDLRRRVGERLGLPPDTPPEVVAEVVVARTSLDEATARHALTDANVQNDNALLELARTVETVRQEILHDR